MKSTGTFDFGVIDHQSSVPPYEQLKNQIILRVRNGKLLSGTKLPTVRQAASDLGLSVNTVARAYKELEEQRIIETNGRLGSFVRASVDEFADRMREAAEQFVDEALACGVDEKRAILYLSAAFSAKARS
ncbi:GntR family transcriptional regulator [Neomicrococcus lactis]|uniref:DNA-binding transcriptional regulator YhcF (GntR family) n=1 Tax=Neomicrococcus lactis TaxID=732241 RepID=A0A7W9DAV4_9MICC|nr:GntR family transcriptional regulator [Neomicrococcus lactis]MBB5597874.1 DNA-binding transcriptional regulator YhcF (GntR family) [Neomicrococcus lactis]